MQADAAMQRRPGVPSCGAKYEGAGEQAIAHAIVHAGSILEPRRIRRRSLGDRSKIIDVGRRSGPSVKSARDRPVQTDRELIAEQMNILSAAPGDVLNGEPFTKGPANPSASASTARKSLLTERQERADLPSRPWEGRCRAQTGQSAYFRNPPVCDIAGRYQAFDLNH